MKKIVCIVLSLLSVLGILCGCDGSWGGDGEKIDPNRTQLNVAKFDGRRRHRLAVRDKRSLRSGVQRRSF